MAKRVSVQYLGPSGGLRTLSAYTEEELGCRIRALKLSYRALGTFTPVPRASTSPITGCLSEEPSGLEAGGE